MNNYEDLNMDKSSYKNTSKNSKILNQSNNTEQFNSFKYKHFNNFYYNIINGHLKMQYLNNLTNQNDNKISSIIKNEFLHKTLNEKLYLSPIMNNNLPYKTAFSYYDNKKIFDNDPSKEKFDNIKRKKFNASSENKQFNKHGIHMPNFKNQKKNFNNNNNIKYINNEENTIPNILTKQIEKNKNKVNSRNASFIQNEFINKSLSEENNKFSKTSESNFLYRNKMQQLPKDAVNGLLLFLKKNKKHLARTSKYYNIYKNYKKYIDNYGLENESISESKNIKKSNHKKVNIGYYGRKPLDGVDIFDITTTYRYRYSNKSEKSRHELILGELNKLKGYIEKNKNEKILFIKDFLNKHNINFDDNNQLKAFENFINNYNKNQFASILKPYLGVKEMILDAMKEGEKLNIIKKYNEKKNYNNSISTINIHNPNNTNNNKDQYISNETNLSESPYLILNQKNQLNSEKKNKSQNQKLNILTVNTYNIYKNKKINNNKTKKFDLYDTNSYLKQIEKQNKLHYPNKDYSSNYNLIVQEIGDELKKLSENIKTEKKFKINDSFIPKQKNKNPHILNNLNNFNFITQTSNKSIDDIFITSNKTLSDNNKFSEKICTYNEDRNLKIKSKNNFNYPNKIKIIKRPNKSIQSNASLNKKRRMNKKMTHIIINKLNLRPPLNIIEVEDVKKRLKLTEYIVFNNAKRKLMFEELGKNELYECVNSNKANKYNNNF